MILNINNVRQRTAPCLMEFERAMIMERTMAGKVYKKANDPTYKEGRKEKSVPKFREFFEKTKRAK